MKRADEPRFWERNRYHNYGTARRLYSIAEPYAQDRMAVTVGFRPRGEVLVIHDSSVRTGPTSTARRMAPDDLREPAAWRGHPSAVAYVSGPDRFVDEAAASLRERGYVDGRVKLQRFGL